MRRSNIVPVTSGVPQGSVLGPILFLIYIYDLPDSTKSKVRLFADDTAIYLAVSSLQDAQISQQDFDHLNKWKLEWNMEFNPGKCVVIHVTRSRTLIPSQYLLYGQVVSGRGNQQQPIIQQQHSEHNHFKCIQTN